MVLICAALWIQVSITSVNAAFAAVEAVVAAAENSCSARNMVY